MPLRQGLNRITGDKTRVYELPMRCWGTTDGGDWLLGERRRSISERDDMIRFQKSASDREGARFFKAEASRHMRCYRALTFIIPHFVLDPPGDCRLRDGAPEEPWYWPTDLADEFDRYALMISAHVWEIARAGR